MLPVLPPPSVPGAVDPAVTQATLATTVCVPGYTATVRPPASYTTALKRRQLAAFGFKVLLSSVEEDHRVPLRIGGAPRDPRNLWPEPWAGQHNAHDKDWLEDEVGRRLCAGRLTLKAAQAIFLGDWWPTYEAWRR
jgi:hypothetical protein